MRLFAKQAGRETTRTLQALLGWVLACLVLAGAHATEPWDVDALMRGMKASRPDKALFVEKKYIALLDRPVESSGELRYQAPDFLEKRTFLPREETIVIQGSTLSLERGGKKHVVQLAQYPELQALMASLRGILSGERRMLEQFFALQLSGNAQHWTLQLKPLKPEVGSDIHLIQLAGMHGWLRDVEIIQTDGDRTVMRIEPVSVP